MRLISKHVLVWYTSTKRRFHIKQHLWSFRYIAPISRFYRWRFFYSRSRNKWYDQNFIPFVIKQKWFEKKKKKYKRPRKKTLKKHILSTFSRKFLHFTLFEMSGLGPQEFLCICSTPNAECSICADLPDKLYHCHCDRCNASPRSKPFVDHKTWLGHKKRSNFKGMKYSKWLSTVCKWLKHKW